MVISPEVMKALREGTAVVALESTIISHGMPYPQVPYKAVSDTLITSLASYCRSNAVPGDLMVPVTTLAFTNFQNWCHAAKEWCAGPHMHACQMPFVSFEPMLRRAMSAEPADGEGC